MKKRMLVLMVTAMIAGFAYGEGAPVNPSILPGGATPPGFSAATKNPCDPAATRGTSAEDRLRAARAAGAGGAGTATISAPGTHSGLNVY